MFNKIQAKEELLEFMSTTNNMLQMHKAGDDLKQQWMLELAMARIALILVNGIEE